LRHCFTRARRKGIIEAYERQAGLGGSAVITGHAKNNKGVWTYKDGELRLPVQELIDKLDGRYSTIMLLLCNSGSHEIISRESIVIHPDGDIYYRDLFFQGKNRTNHGYRTRMYIPGRGYLS
jgi:hypothetical protein